MTETPKSLKLTHTLAITWGETSISLPIVRLVATQTSSSPLLRGTAPPFALMASESVEIVVRCDFRDFPDMLHRTMTDGIPYAHVRFAPYTVDALVKPAEAEARKGGGTLLRLLLLRVPVGAIWFDESEWEKDEEHSYSRDGVHVTAVKPKPRLDDHAN